MKKYNYIYKTTNLITGHAYIGVHSTDNLKDGYIGCGIKRQSDANNKSKKSRFMCFAKAVSKYGYLNFKKEILFFFKNKEDAYYFESKIVNAEFIKRKDTYNVKLGGICPPSSKGIKRTSSFKKGAAKRIKNYQNKLIEMHSKKYKVVDVVNKKIYNVCNLKKFSRTMNLNSNGLYSVSIGRSSLYKKQWWVCEEKNWKGFSQLNTIKTVNYLYHKNGSMIEFSSLKEASEKTGEDKSNIHKVISGKLNQSKGWSCKKW